MTGSGLLTSLLRSRIVHILAADASSYITGQVWSVNGGMDM